MALYEPSSNDPIHEDEYGKFYVMEKVMQVRFKCQEMQFRVRWKGFSSKADTWLPLEDVSDTESEYLAVSGIPCKAQIDSLIAEHNRSQHFSLFLSTIPHLLISGTSVQVHP